MLYTAAGTRLETRPTPPRSPTQQSAKDAEDASRAEFLEEFGELEPERAPDHDRIEQGVALAFHASLDLPRAPEQWNTAPVDRDEAYELLEMANELLFELCPVDRRRRNDHLLGYPAVSSLMYDPTPTGSVHLLNLFSHADLGWCWHDGDYLHVSITPEALRKRDFGTVANDAG